MWTSSDPCARLPQQAEGETRRCTESERETPRSKQRSDSNVVEMVESHRAEGRQRRPGNGLHEEPHQSRICMCESFGVGHHNQNGFIVPFVNFSA